MKTCDSGPHSMQSFNTFINTQSHRGGNYFDNETDGKKYKLRLKFDGACVLEVVRLNGGHFQNLTHLDISGNSAEKLDLRSLNRLEWLCCANNNLEVLLLSGTSLTYLDCSYNNLLSISVDPVPNNLSTLQISYNNLEELPTWSWMVPELFIIYASHNRLRQLDCKFQSCLSNLPIRELHLHCNRIEFVSKDFIQRATRLKTLNLSRNFIEYMPNLGKKCSIQELYLSRNRLQDSDEKDALDFLSECSQLRRLYLAFNKIEHISERCITAWKNLEELILCGNRIRSLPTKISTLSNLKVLRVHSNSLETAPNFTKMPALKVVDLSHNRLRKINLDHLISGANLTYLDISCNERLSLSPEKLSSQHQRRPMNLVEVSHPRKIGPVRQNEIRDFPANPPWELGFSELPDRNQTLSVSQYRDVNLSNGKEALFGLFDGGDGNPAPKYISKSIAKIYAEEKNIEETHGFSLKYTLLNAMKSIRQQGYNRPLQGILCLLSTHEDNHYPGKQSFYLNLAMVGGIRCLLVESGKKVTRLTDVTETGLENKRPQEDGNDPPSFDNNSETSSSKSGGASNGNNLNGNIPDPKVLSIPLSTSSEFLIIGNQSMWSYVNEPELIEELENNRQRKSVLIAKRVADMAQSHTCKESISLIIVKFKWHVNPQGTRPTVLGSSKNKLKPHVGVGEFGPLSYYSASSEYSEASNPLISVVTPDSAIDTDRSSGTGSVGSTPGSAKSNSSNRSGQENPSNLLALTNNPPRTSWPEGSRFQQEEKEDNTTQRMSGASTAVLSSSKSQLDSGRDSTSNVVDICTNDRGDEEEVASIANTSISQMSVEQFKCWEYMLEQNTKLLFKKELDTLSKGVFQRNQKLRKSVHFPYQQQDASNVGSFKQNNKSAQNLVAPGGLQSSRKTTPGFYTLSKAKSLSHLFAADSLAPKAVPIIEPSTRINGIQKPKSNFTGLSGSGSNSTNTPSGFLGSVRSSARRAILGGPNAAYFSSSQRQINAAPQRYYEDSEIQEVKNFDSIEHDSRLKKYWENKITEL